MASYTLDNRHASSMVNEPQIEVKANNDLYMLSYIMQNTLLRALFVLSGVKYNQRLYAVLFDKGAFASWLVVNKKF